MRKTQAVAQMTMARERVAVLEAEVERLTDLCQRNSDDLAFLDQCRAEVERLKIQRDAALVHGPEDMIRALEESQAEVERLMDDVQSTGKLWHDAEERADKAEAEVARLRSELHQIEDTPCLSSEPTALLLRRMARAALAPEVKP